MDISRGAVGGDLVNTFPVNGSTWFVDASGIAILACQAAATAVARRGALGTSASTVSGQALARRRRAAVPVAGIDIGASALGRRRAQLHGQADAAIDASSIATRRASAASSATIGITVVPILKWRYRQRAPRERVILVPIERAARAMTER